MPKERIIEKILEILQSQAESTVSLLDIFFSDYTSSYRKARQSMTGGSRQFKTDWADWYRQRQRFYSLLNHLKKQGFIEKNTRDKKQPLWRITKKGRDKSSSLKNIDPFSRRTLIYKKEADNKLKIIIFDVPESERHKREWLREALHNLGFLMLQKSVWMGKNKMPEGFLNDLKKRGMLSYIHIFEISKRGTISKIS